MFRKLAKQALGVVVLEFLGEAARKAGEVLAERATAKYRLQEVEIVEVQPVKKKGKK